MIEKNSFDRLDDAIDRTVRDMTHVATDDRAVARVMARVRGARAESDKRWTLTPRAVAWCGALAFLLMALMSWHSRIWLRHPAEAPPVAVNAPAPLPSREFPTPVVAAPSIPQATTARITRDSVVTASSIANGPADASERSAAVEMPPFESGITLASIVPAPLAEAPAIPLEPLTTSLLQVDEIPVASIDVPPVSPERRE